MVILPIVEGFSEVESVPILLRRILISFQAFHVDVAKPFRVKRNKLIRHGKVFSEELSRAIISGIRNRSPIDAIILLLDADDDCPRIVGAKLKEGCSTITSLPTVVNMAERELEGWFLGGKESLRNVRGIIPDARAPSQPEKIRGAKELISKNMERGRRYIAVDDQPAFAERLDLDLAQRRCQSLKKFVADMEKLILLLST